MMWSICFIFLLSICTSSLEKCLSKSFSYFKIGLLVFLLSYQSSLYILGVHASVLLHGFSRVWLSATWWTVGHQAPLPWDSPGKNTGWSYHALLQGGLPDPGIEPASPVSPALQDSSLLLSYQESPCILDTDVCLTNIFSHSVGCLFTFLIMSIKAQKLKIFMFNNLCFLFCWCHV